MTVSPYMHFDRAAWQQLRQDTPMPLTEQDLDNLHGQVETVSLSEIREVYLPLSRLLNYVVTAKQALHHSVQRFLDAPEPKVPFVIGVAGSVAVGKSTTSRVLQALLSCWSNHPRVAIVTTDNFIYPNAKLAELEIMHRKGFPESYDLLTLLHFLADLKSGKSNLSVPIYSHHDYDIVPDKCQTVDQPDIVILEGLNILQSGNLATLQSPSVFVSDYLDFSIFVDAKPELIEQWYLQRFLTFWQSAFKDPQAFFHRFSELNQEEATKMALRYWHEINQVNLEQNILPFKHRAQLILQKVSDHSVQNILLRKV